MLLAIVVKLSREETLQSCTQKHKSIYSSYAKPHNIHT